jgi:sporulation protein YlmC with PRC-barrel domain
MARMSTGGKEEQIDIGADVVGSDGDGLGSVAYVVVRPPELHLTDIVVSTGSILGRDVVVPIDQVERVEGGKVYLSLDKGGVDQCKDYVEIHYDQPPSMWAPPAGYYYPGSMTLWPSGEYYPQPASVDVNAPSGTVGLNQGMEVESSDGHKVGTIDAIDADPHGEDVTALVVKRGHLFSHHDVRIPIDCVADVEADRVKLSLTAHEVKTRFEAD